MKLLFNCSLLMALRTKGYKEFVQTGFIGPGGIEGKGAITGKLSKYPVNKLVSLKFYPYFIMIKVHFHYNLYVFP